MKEIIATLVFCAGSIIATSAPAQGKQDFLIVNRTGYTINELYISTSKAKTWRNDILGESTLGNNRQRNIRFKPTATSCRYDLKVLYEDKDEAEWGDIDLCTVSKVTIRYNRKSGQTSVDQE